MKDLEILQLSKNKNVSKGAARRVQLLKRFIPLKKK
jgi:hypothetical protein